MLTYFITHLALLQTVQILVNVIDVEYLVNCLCQVFLFVYVSFNKDPLCKLLESKEYKLHFFEFSVSLNTKLITHRASQGDEKLFTLSDE